MQFRHAAFEKDDENRKDRPEGGLSVRNDPVLWRYVDQWVCGESSSVLAGTETTLGIPHAVDTRIGRENPAIVWVNTKLTTAATRPAQSSTGAPEAP